MPQTVVITGASAGVGRATARRFAVEGARIGLIARDPERLEETAEEVRQLGGEALPCPADVADAEAVASAAGAVEERFGPIDVWVNAAMATIFGRFAEITPEEFRRATEVTYLGFVNGTRSALARMQPRDRGTILQVGSALAYRSIPLQSAYCGAKHAIVGFTDSLRSELIHGGSGIELVMVHLPGMNTPQFEWSRNKTGERPQPVPPIYQPSVAAEAIHYAVEHPRRELWLGWATLKTILGQRLAPGLLDRILADKAYDGQLTGVAERARPDNLFKPVRGRFGARGRFNDRARSGSSELWLVEHAGGLAAAGGVALGLLAGWALARQATRH
ncbi:Short-chain dehydrogenase [Tistlia consotensis]|uniref:Short-chain dehydrogenase n=1 Tax=Tistlia consotensis USBA 355 TaxID=560819 RepID=A0A1Y6CSI0_9PROT|nr:SDR family oxidoreductase [Tistlia consotensis]SMF76122.1 Short-chain dehydrogenase [Tistlia consotensis USBA 355]SNS12255.1 Short-chain dehydrogenase [Tistlia consotensis]